MCVVRGASFEDGALTGERASASRGDSSRRLRMMGGGAGSLNRASDAFRGFQEEIGERGCGVVAADGAGVFAHSRELRGSVEQLCNFLEQPPSGSRRFRDDNRRSGSGQYGAVAV